LFFVDPSNALEAVPNLTEELKRLVPAR